LWETFLEKKEMTAQDFRKQAVFKPKAIAGFFRFITGNGLATRSGDTFYLNSEVIPEIRKLLGKNT